MVTCPARREATRWVQGELDLSERRYPESCSAFRAMVRRDSLDFSSWFGLGDCLSRDPLVVPDSGSPSRYRFRSSFAEAAGAFQVAHVPHVEEIEAAVGEDETLPFAAPLPRQPDGRVKIEQRRHRPPARRRARPRRG